MRNMLIISVYLRKKWSLKVVMDHLHKLTAKLGMWANGSFCGFWLDFTQLLGEGDDKKLRIIEEKNYGHQTNIQ